MVEKISRSEQKRLHKQIEELAGELADLTDKDLKNFPGRDEVTSEIISCRGLQGGARKRQIKYLAKVLKKFPLEEVYLYMQSRKGSELNEKQLFHRAEHWRDVLISEAVNHHEYAMKNKLPFEQYWVSPLLEDLLAEIPNLDEAEIRRSLHQYAKTRNRVHYREVFRMIKAAIDAESRTDKERPQP